MAREGYQIIAGGGRSGPWTLHNEQWMKLIMLGFGFWLLGAILVHFAPYWKIFGKWNSLYSFVISIPLSWASIWLCARVCHLSGEQMVAGISIGIAAAMYGNSVSLTWLNWLYGPDGDDIILGLAWILWFDAWLILAAFFEAWRLENENSGQELSLKQQLIICPLGVIYWFSGAMVSKFGGPWGFFGPLMSLLSFGLAIPLIWLAVFILIELSTLSLEQIAAGVSLCLAAALLCDGVALTWFPKMYGSLEDDIIFGVSWIFWGGFVTICAALVEIWRRVHYSET